MASQELKTILEVLRAMESDPDATIEQARQNFEAFGASLPLPEGATNEAVDAGGVPAEWVSAPGSDRQRVVLYLHGGGYCIGSAATHRSLTARLSAAAEAVVLAIDYRLGPEHPHPAAVEDAEAAYRWLLDNGTDPNRLVVAGDSAGGGLTVATLLALRDGGVPLPAAAVCLSPWVDLECAGESMTTKADADAIVQRQRVLEMAAAYLGDGDPRAPLASPVHADLTGLPPLLIQVGTAETLLDDSIRLAERAEAAGVEVTLEPWEDMIHVWQLFPILPEAAEAIDRIGEFVRKHAG